MLIELIGYSLVALLAFFAFDWLSIRNMESFLSAAWDGNYKIINHTKVRLSLGCIFAVGSNILSYTRNSVLLGALIVAVIIYASLYPLGAVKVGERT